VKVRPPLPILFGLLALGCSGEKSGWPSILSSIPAGGAAYSLSFYAAPPDGTIVSGGVFPGATAAATCGNFMSRSLPRDFWYLRFELTSAAAVDYSVASTNVLPSPSPTVQASVIHVVGQEKAETHPAKAGTFVVSQVESDPAQWPGGKEMKAHVALTFSTSSWTRGRCEWGQAVDAEAMRSCMCNGPNGETATCIPIDGNDDCCSRFGGGDDLPLELDVDAVQCPWMCTFTSPELARNCLDLQQ